MSEKGSLIICIHNIYCCYHPALFNVVSGDRNSIDLQQLTDFLEQIIQVTGHTLAVRVA